MPDFPVRMPASRQMSPKEGKTIDDALERFPDRNATAEQDSQPGLLRNMRVEALIDAVIA